MRGAVWLMTSPPHGAERWQGLGALLIQRRTALSPRYHNRRVFSEATGLNYRVIYDIEEARRTNFGHSTLAAIEAAYKLEPGAISRYLDGGELEPQRGERAGAAPLSVVPDLPAPSLGRGFRTTPEVDARIEPFLPGILERVVNAQRQLGPGETPSGRQVFPDAATDPYAADLARAWDHLAEMTSDPMQLAQLLGLYLAGEQRGKGTASG